MSVFISWSGTRSKHVARELRQWLPNVLQAAEICMSDADIEAGNRGINEIFVQLEKATFGILVVTPGNREAPWLLFEAGALCKKLGDRNRVCPYLLEMTPADIAPPLAEFQSVAANRDGTLRLVKSINNSFTPHLLKDDALLKTFEMWWPSLERPLNEWISKAKTQPNRFTERQLLTEILGTVRDLTRRLDQHPWIPLTDLDRAKLLGATQALYSTEAVKELYRRIDDNMR